MIDFVRGPSSQIALPSATERAYTGGSAEVSGAATPPVLRSKRTQTPESGLARAGVHIYFPHAYAPAPPSRLSKRPSTDGTVDGLNPAGQGVSPTNIEMAPSDPAKKLRHENLKPPGTDGAVDYINPAG